MRSALVSAFLLTVGCKDNSGDSNTEATLPPEDDSPGSYDTGLWNSTDSGFGGNYNEEPPYLLTIQHTGNWTMSPITGPYTSMTGQLEIIEYLDGNEENIWCRAVFALTGQASKDTDTCEDCDFTFDILFFLYEEGAGKDKEDDDDDDDPEVGGLDKCRTPDLPGGSETRTMGFIRDVDTIYYNYYDSGIWLPWYDAEQAGNDLTLSWTADVGFAGEEEEEDE